MGGKSSADTLGVWILEIGGVGENLVYINMLTRDGLPMVRDLWTETRGDRKSLGVNEWASEDGRMGIWYR